MSKENFAVFQEQSRRLLDQIEMSRVKTALADFLQNKNLKKLVEEMVDILDTDEKAQMLPTISTLIPQSQKEEFDALIVVFRGSAVEPLTGDNEEEIDPFADEIDPFGDNGDDPFEGLNEQEIAMKIMDDPSLAERMMEQQEQEERKKEQHPFKGLTESEIAQKIMDDPSLAEYDMPEEDDEDDNEEESMFDLVIRMAEADLKGDELTKQKTEAKMKRRESQKQSQQQQQQQEEPKKKAFSRQHRPSVVVKTLPDYFCTAKSRGEAKAFIQMARPETGLFLLRKKDTSITGSFKRKPGQKLPYRMWALSYIDRDNSLKNVLLEQKEKNGLIYFGAQPIKNVHNPHMALQKMTKEFVLNRTPFQCKRWFHGTIDRKEAEARLAELPKGSFLVRKSTKEERMYVLSVADGSGKKVFHNKIKHEGNSWVAASAPQQVFSCVSDLIQHHKSASFGLTSLTTPVPRPEPYRLDVEEEEEEC
eukprot:m.119264 g.119264  ORF g.119264 m.119264 type:complete len:476 (-) comp12906_c3_seq4:3761-5188(-)